ncbi:MAG TPA: c-type cytochrome [Steroidobacteraceae bacterium]|nr:c-type cytochrome [Steroidobacteraceae bacterium]
MRSADTRYRLLLSATATTAFFLLAGPRTAQAQDTSAGVASSPVPACADDAGLKLPTGFCASIFADNLGHVRHMVAAPDGVLYVNTWSGRYYSPDAPPPPGGFLIALQDKNGRGKANIIRRFGATQAEGGHGGTGIALYHGYLYAELNDRIVRYRMSPGSIVPTGSAETVVSGLPLTGDHPMHPFAIDADGWLYVDSASPSNACQKENRMLESPGISPCPELATRGGIWRYSAKKLHQKFSPAARYATGIRNADGIVVDPTGHNVYSTQQGRDQLGQNWPKLFTPQQGAYLPSEEVMHIVQGGDYGWPYCYYDGVRRELMLAPEYGGNGRKVGVCARKLDPFAAFPAHWAPNDMSFYSGKQFPSQYRGGIFVAFHGSWNRAPFPQQGYNVVFQPVADGKASGSCVIFAEGFAEGQKDPGAAAHRPSGLAVGPHGALYVADDVRGRIYKIVYRGGPGSREATGIAACPNVTALAGTAGSANPLPPEGIHPHAGGAMSTPVPKGASRAMVDLGDRIFHGEVASGTCAGCHGAEGKGTPLGPNLTAGKWLWSDGSLSGIERTISRGVPKPKEYRSPMPPMGGAQLDRQQVSAVAAYVWGLGHAGAH